MTQKLDAVGIGALNLDLIYRADLKEVSKVVGSDIVPGSEEFLQQDKFSLLIDYMRSDADPIGRSGGGSACNTIYALARMRFECGYIGRTGKDKESDYLLQELEAVGIDISRVFRGDGHCGMCISIVDGERTLLIFPNENDNFEKADIDLGYAMNSRFVHMSSFACITDDRALSAQVHVAQNLPRDARLSFDPGELYARKGVQILPIIKRSNVIFMNEREAEMLSFKDDFARELFNGVELAVIKKGREGSTAFSKNGRSYEGRALRIPEYLITDTTGAGDVYDAGFLAGQLLGKDPQQCSGFANFVAGRSITALGRAAYPTKDSLRYFG